MSSEYASFTQNAALSIIYMYVFIYRESHCEIERRRRCKMASYVNELSEMVPACNTLAKKPDKLTILRLAAAHMKSLQGGNLRYV